MLLSSFFHIVEPMTEDACTVIQSYLDESDVAKVQKDGMKKVPKYLRKSIAEEQSTDMIVVGKSSRKVRGSRVMGATAKQVNRLSKIPVLMVPNNKINSTIIINAEF